MKPCFLLAFALLCYLVSGAVTVSGRVTGNDAEPLSYASLQIKGSGKGTTSSSDGWYTLELAPGNYTLICQYVGYEKQEQKITVEGTSLTVNFRLNVLQTTMKEVIVKSGGEDPAYEIIRNAIKKRPVYEAPLDSFTCEAYIKTLMKMRSLPKRILGQKIDNKDKQEMGVDSMGKGIIYLSESLTKVAFARPDHGKLEVISGRESGSNGYGFNFPTFINFYDNNVNVLTSQFAPRGFVSPVADGALNFYRYKYLGSFWEDGKEITQIKVIPRRKYEPLFSGTINITEGEWRIHSLDLLLTKESQLQLLDTMRIQQLHAPLPGNSNIWRTKDQMAYFTFNILGIDAVGTMLNVYNQYNAHPGFPKNYFNRVVVSYDTAVNKHSRQYWDSVRPVQLEPEEIKDYKVKDSIYQRELDSAGTKNHRDSLRKRQGNITVIQVLKNGFSRSDFHPYHPVVFSWEGAIKGLQYNTAEGTALSLQASLNKRWRHTRRSVTFTPHLRYGFENRHLNPWASLNFTRYAGNDGDSWQQEGNNWILSGGKRVSQFNNENPIRPLFNSLYTLLEHRNYMKTYENYFAEIRFSRKVWNDIQLQAGILYENRLPLENSTDYSFFKKHRIFTPNYPVEQLTAQFPQHQAVVASIGLQYQPGQRYIQYPRRKVAIGSKYPTFLLTYTKGISGLLGSDVNYDKWRLSVRDDLNAKLLGVLKYRLAAGGFLNTKQAYIQDYQHFNGNQLLLAGTYLNSFQLAPYYANSTTASFYLQGHAEHHFNGMLTNKIPLLKKLNWHLVAGVNAFYVNSDNHYTEIFAGLENIFKVLRVDVVGGYLNGNSSTVGVRIGLGGLLGSSLSF